FFQAEDGIRDFHVTGVQTCALPILAEKAINFNSKEDFLASDFGGMTVADKLVEQTGVIGEKLDITAFEKLEAPYVGSYVHINKRSEERRVGKECRYQWRPYDDKRKQ